MPFVASLEVYLATQHAHPEIPALQSSKLPPLVSCPLHQLLVLVLLHLQLPLSLYTDKLHLGLLPLHLLTSLIAVLLPNPFTFAHSVKKGLFLWTRRHN